jgi:hypothetical protein
MLRNDVYLCIINTFGANVKSAAEVLTPHGAGEKIQPKFFRRTMQGKKFNRSFSAALCREKNSAEVFLPHRAGEKIQPKFFCRTVQGKKFNRSYDISCVTSIINYE